MTDFRSDGVTLKLQISLWNTNKIIAIQCRLYILKYQLILEMGCSFYCYFIYRYLFS